MSEFNDGKNTTASGSEWDFDNTRWWDDLSIDDVGLDDLELEIPAQPPAPPLLWKPHKKQERTKSVEAPEVLPFDEVAIDLVDPRYQTLGHGTNSIAADSILTQGLRVGDTTGYFARSADVGSNFLPLSHDVNELKDMLNTWNHNNAKQIVVFRMPVKYKLLFSHNDPRTYALGYHDNDPETEPIGQGTYETEYIYGYYDADDGSFHKNPNYHGDLDNEDDATFMEAEHQTLIDDYLSTMPEDKGREWREANNDLYSNYNP